MRLSHDVISEMNILYLPMEIGKYSCNARIVPQRWKNFLINFFKVLIFLIKFVSIENYTRFKIYSKFLNCNTQNKSK